MTTPDRTAEFMDKAEQIASEVAFVNSLTECTNMIARALSEVAEQYERKGMERAEAICYARADDHMVASRQYTPDADENSHLTCLECALEANRCGADIRAQTGEGA